MTLQSIKENWITLMRMIWFARTFLAYSAEHKERTKLFSEDFSGKCNEKVELD